MYLHRLVVAIIVNNQYSTILRILVSVIARMINKFTCLNFEVEQQKSEIRFMRKTLNEILRGAREGLSQSNAILEQLNLDVERGDLYS